MRPRVPYTIIGGYLGAGKTTLVNHLLTNRHGLRVAVLVNDFGSINIDAELIAEHDGDTIQLANGCICCSISEGYVNTMARVLEHADRLDHIIVEASGVADPVKISQYGPMLRLRLDGIIVLADAEQVRQKAQNKYVGDMVMQQIRGADLIVLNKADLVSATELAEVRQWLLSLAPDVGVLETVRSQLPLALLVGVHESRPELDTLPTHADDTHRQRYETWQIESDVAVTESAVAEFITALPDSILRAKGYVYLAEQPEQRMLLQLVGKRWELTAAGTWGDGTPATGLVLIGLPDSVTQSQLDAVFVPLAEPQGER